MLEQQSNYTPPNPNVQQLRNNLTPSPLYSEPRRYATPNANSANAVNVANPNADVPWFPFTNSHSNLNNEINNYNGWLATNTIQTQSFMLNTLNQCCQMLWLQQRELVSLRNNVAMVSFPKIIVYIMKLIYIIINLALMYFSRSLKNTANRGFVKNLELYSKYFLYHLSLSYRVSL